MDSLSQTDGKGKQRAGEILDVEDDEKRQERIHELFSKLNASAAQSATNIDASPRPFEFGDRKTFPVGPPLELLSRVQAFLPELAASNTDLLRRAREDPSSVDIENLDQDQAQYIEMNLGLGVFEHRGNPDNLPPGIPVAHVDLDADINTDGSSPSSSASSSSSSSAASSSSSSSDSDSDSSSEGGSEDPGPDSQQPDVPPAPPAPRPTKPLPRRNPPAPAPLAAAQSPKPKPEIVVLSESVHHPGT